MRSYVRPGLKLQRSMYGGAARRESGSRGPRPPHGCRWRAPAARHVRPLARTVLQSTCAPTVHPIGERASDNRLSVRPLIATDYPSPASRSAAVSLYVCDPNCHWGPGLPSAVRASTTTAISVHISENAVHPLCRGVRRTIDATPPRPAEWGRSAARAITPSSSERTVPAIPLKISENGPSALRIVRVLPTVTIPRARQPIYETP